MYFSISIVFPLLFSNVIVIWYWHYHNISILPKINQPGKVPFITFKGILGFGTWVGAPPKFQGIFIWGGGGILDSL
jgi:hypothetical protein